ncbi:MAG: YqgE/AlgH family protein [Planctomycetales bacterium]
MQQTTWWRYEGFMEQSAMEFLKGQLLVATPQLTDPNFSRTVVLMIEHDENGAFGVILNRPSARTVADVWSEMENSPCECLEAINVGGPVMGPILALHSEISLSEAEVLPGVYLAAQRDTLDKLVRRAEAEFRLFSGYAGWGEGQLDYELKQGGWITTVAKDDYIFDLSDDLWRRVGNDITQNVLRGAMNIKHFPDDPSVN